MSLPWAAHGLKIRYMVRNDWQSRGLTLATAAVVHTHGRHCLGAKSGRRRRPLAARLRPLRDPSTDEAGYRSASQGCPGCTRASSSAKVSR